MPYRPRIYALMMFSFLGMAVVKLAAGGYLLATMESEAQIEQRA